MGSLTRRVVLALSLAVLGWDAAAGTAPSAHAPDSLDGGSVPAEDSFDEHARGARPPTVRDAIEMVRIGRFTTADGRIGTFSSDGRLFAFVTWQGDLSRNVNVYKLVIVDLTRPPKGNLRTVVTKEFTGDPDDQNAAPFEHIAFAGNGRLINYLGREPGKPQEVYSVDIQTGEVQQLTHHSSAIREFAADSQGRVRVFSAVAASEEDAARAAKLDADGVFVTDEALFNPMASFAARSILDPPDRSLRRYFLADRKQERLIYDSRQNRAPRSTKTVAEQERGFSVKLDQDWTLRKFATLTADEQGRFALMFPYLSERDDNPDATAKSGKLLNAWSGKLAAPYGLVNLATGHIEPFIPAPHLLASTPNGNSPVWAPDGRSALVFTTFPAAASDEAPSTAAEWLEVDVASRKIQRLHIPASWQVAGWSADGQHVILSSDNRFALLSRAGNGEWGGISDIGTFENLNWRWMPATNGRVLVGVTEGLQSPPELIAIDVATRRTTVLTDLNPQLRDRTYATAEPFQWAHKYDAHASGFLIKPQDFRGGVRYPLVVLLDDDALKRIEQPYLLDGFIQLNGHAVQMLAAAGFVVLYAREPAASPNVSECERMREHVETAVDALDRAGIIDPARVGLSGWSRAAYYTDCILMSARMRFAAATRMDGGGLDFLPRLRPYTDDELRNLRTPLLIETHGLRNLVMHTEMSDRLAAFGRPTEVLYFHTAPHSTVRPQHRLRSLQTHIDWWRFWLQGEEDGNPDKQAQYARWERARASWDAILTPTSELSKSGNGGLSDRQLRLE